MQSHDFPRGFEWGIQFGQTYSIRDWSTMQSHHFTLALKQEFTWNIPIWLTTGQFDKPGVKIFTPHIFCSHTIHVSLVFITTNTLHHGSSYLYDSFPRPSGNFFCVVILRRLRRQMCGAIWRHGLCVPQTPSPFPRPPWRRNTLWAGLKLLSQLITPWILNV